MASISANTIKFTNNTGQTLVVSYSQMGNVWNNWPGVNPSVPSKTALVLDFTQIAHNTTAITLAARDPGMQYHSYAHDFVFAAGGGQHNVVAGYGANGGIELH